jgi:hypothetical protein
MNVVTQIAEHGVVLEQMSQRLRAGQVIDGYDVNLFVMECTTKNVAADAAKSVDAYLRRHVTSLCKRRSGYAKNPKLPEYESWSVS